MAPSEKRDSRRVEITKAAIKDGMLSLLKGTAFQNISVASLCREAGVGRATFYAHYTGLMDVIDELADEAIHAADETDIDSVTAIDLLIEKIKRMGNATELEAYITLLPLCQRVAHSPQYNVLFHDDEVAKYIIMRIYRQEKRRTIPVLVQQLGVTADQADKLFLFGVMGAFAVNRAMGWKKNDEWYDMQKLLLTYAHGGYDAIRKLPKPD